MTSIAFARRFLIVPLLVLLLVLLGTRLLNETQHLWAPFKISREETLIQDGDKIHAIIRVNVNRRYDVKFRERVVHLETSTTFADNAHDPITARTGEFTLEKEFQISPDTLPGRYCHITEWWVTYNRVNQQYGVYDPACIDITDATGTLSQGNG